MRIRVHLLILLAAVLGSQAFAETYHVSPTTGRDDGDGSARKPWKTLAAVVESGKLATLKPGDTLLLATGPHGNVSLNGNNARPITIAAAENHKPQLGRLTIGGGSGWRIRGLIVSPVFAPEPYKGSIVSIGDASAASDITIEDCFVYTAEDSSEWSVEQWMQANSGILLGRHGKGLVVRNCFVLNTRFGITMSSYDAVCEGNVVSGFSADGMRVTRDGAIVRHNIIKDTFVGSGDGDANHDDAIQCFLFNKGTGEVKNVTIDANIIIGNEDPTRRFARSPQGIGFFDGPLVDFVVTNNVVNVNHWHGISLYDAEKARVEDNVVWTAGDAGPQAWIMFGAKLKQARDNTARDNYAKRFKLNQPGTQESGNDVVTQEIYNRALAGCYKAIVERFGEKHPLTGLPRLASPPR